MKGSLPKSQKLATVRFEHKIHVPNPNSKPFEKNKNWTDAIDMLGSESKEKM
jgi:hypothetical protein